jgi:hypothetical protein
VGLDGGSDWPTGTGRPSVKPGGAGAVTGLRAVVSVEGRHCRSWAEAVTPRVSARAAIVAVTRISSTSWQSVVARAGRPHHATLAILLL